MPAFESTFSAEELAEWDATQRHSRPVPSRYHLAWLLRLGGLTWFDVGSVLGGINARRAQGLASWHDAATCWHCQHALKDTS